MLQKSQTENIFRKTKKEVTGEDVVQSGWILMRRGYLVTLRAPCTHREQGKCCCKPKEGLPEVSLAAPREQDNTELFLLVHFKMKFLFKI